MSVYAIGDIQGCYTELRNLLDKLNFDPQYDQIWLCGDLVNRGPDSLSTLRFLNSIKQSVITVQGNHDLHLLAIADGISTTKDASLLELLNAPDAQELLDWLRQQPLLHHDEELGYTLVHAGIFPLWSLAQAMTHAHELEQVLRSDQHHDFFEHMYGNEPVHWSEDLHGWDRLRFICNSFTRMRFVAEDGALELHSKAGPTQPPPGCQPWYHHPRRMSIPGRILFGHWSTLGLIQCNNVQSLDTGCVWGGQLTAYQLGSNGERHITIQCTQFRNPVPEQHSR